MSGFDDELDQALGGGGFDDELAAALGGGAAAPPEPEPEPADPRGGILSGLMAARERMGGGTDPLERMAEAAVGAYTPGVFKGAAAGAKGLKAGLQTLAADVGNQALGGAAYGAAGDLRATAGGDEGLLDRLMSAGGEALRGGGMAGAGAAALGTIGKPVGAAAKWVGDRARDVVAGVNARDAKAIAGRYGLDEVSKRFGQALESEVQSPWYGWSSGRYSKELASRAGPQGAEVQKQLAQAGQAEGVDAFAPGAMQNVADRVQAEADKLAGAVADDLVERRQQLVKLADRLRNGLTGKETLSDLVGRKSELQRFGHSTGGVGVPETASKEAHAAAGSIARDELRGAMSYATDPTREAWQGANDQYARTKMLEKLTKNKAAGEFTAGNLGGTLAGGVVGAIGGAATGAVSDDFSPLSGAGAGFLAGSGLGAGATNSAARQAVGTWGSDITANAMRGLSGVAQATPAIGGYAGRMADGATHGHDNSASVERALTSNPQALGQYGPKLQAAQQRGELAEEVDRLYDEPEFRALLRGLQ